MFEEENRKGPANAEETPIWGGPPKRLEGRRLIFLCGVLLIVSGLGCADSRHGHLLQWLGVENTRYSFSGEKVLLNQTQLGKREEQVPCEPVQGYLEARLASLGASLLSSRAVTGHAEGSHGHVKRELHSTVAVLEGRSEDPILLMAPYRVACGEGSEGNPQSAWANASFLLELGRVLSAQPQPYTIWLIFIPENSSVAQRSASIVESLSTPWLGSERVAEALKAEGVLNQVRVAIFFDGLGSTGESVSRDSHSHPVYREVFWESAQALDATDVFSDTSDLSSSALGHHAFLGKGLRRTVLITTGTSEISENRTDSATQNSQANRWQKVGRVSVEALGRIGRRLQRMDKISGG